MTALGFADLCTLTNISKIPSNHAKVYLIVTCNSYTTGTSALPDIALGLVRMYQAKHKCPWYNHFCTLRKIG